MVTGPRRDTLAPEATEVCEVRWRVPWWRTTNIQVRRFRRPRDAAAFAEKLRGLGIDDIGVWVASIGPWQPVDDDTRRRTR